ncbi:MAG: hypothetical protein ACQERS_05210 [Bacteroidota bacterium]
MKIAIHKSSKDFSDKWIEYCKRERINYKLVNCYSNSIISDIDDCTALMWHFHHENPRDILFAKELIYAVGNSGKKVFPDFNTSWHFDDKIGQKYILEAIGAPLVPSYVFYSKSEAKEWVQSANFPKVFKLRRGASAANVRLVRTKKQALRLINKAFRSGFRLYNPWWGLTERWRKFRMKKAGIYDLIKGVVRILIKTRFEKVQGNEKGYIYFQDFIEGCSFDIRVKVIGNKCQAFKRMVRKNDFKASGSGFFSYVPKEIPKEVIKTAFIISEKLNLQSAAFDFVISKDNKCLLLEMSYMWGYADVTTKFLGYWDHNMCWHEDGFNPFEGMVDTVI